MFRSGIGCHLGGRLQVGSGVGLCVGQCLVRFIYWQLMSLVAAVLSMLL
jgi:hypothetical protein